MAENNNSKVQPVKFREAEISPEAKLFNGLSPVKSSLPQLNSAKGGPASLDLTGRASVAPSAQPFNRVKMFLPAIVLATSLRYSTLFTMGIVVGYTLCKVFCHLFVHNGKIDSVFIDYGKWKVHLHHWIIGIIILAVVWFIDHWYLPTFFAGAVCGMIIQDIYDYNDWHKVIVKNEDHRV